MKRPLHHLLLIGFASLGVLLHACNGSVLPVADNGGNGSSSGNSRGDAAANTDPSGDAGRASSGDSSNPDGSLSSGGTPPDDIHTFLGCLQSINSTRVSDAVACVPSGCYSTLTTSTISVQPGCTLGDGTPLPRVDLSCQGPGGSQILRFRLTFTLCTQGGAIHHIEVAEDGNSNNDQKMGDIDSRVGFQTLTEFGAGTGVVDTSIPANDKGCAQCHLQMGTVSAGGNTINLFEDLPPDGDILFTNDPAQGPPPAHQTPLSDICTRVAGSTQLAANPSDQSLAVDLCNNLAVKTP